MNKDLFPLKGIVTVLNTPFTDDNRIDLKSLIVNVNYALDAGVAGFLVPAMATEVYKLSEGERLDMLRTVLDTVGDKAIVIGGAGETDLSKSKRILKSYLEIGCKNVLFQIPFENESQFRKHFMELAALNPKMIMLQDWDASGYGLADDLILDLFENVPAFRCLKVETVPAGVKYSRMLDLTDGKLNISGGWAVSQMIEGLKRGVHAFMPTGMHYTYCAIYKMYKEGDFDKAEELFKKILPVLAFSNQHLDISIHFFKRLLYKQGLYPTSNSRKPILPFDTLHQEIADKHINFIIETERDLMSS